MRRTCFFKVCKFYCADKVLVVVVETLVLLKCFVWFVFFFVFLIPDLCVWLLFSLDVLEFRFLFWSDIRFEHVSMCVCVVSITINQWRFSIFSQRKKKAFISFENRTTRTLSLKALRGSWFKRLSARPASLTHASEFLERFQQTSLCRI